MGRRVRARDAGEPVGARGCDRRVGAGRGDRAHDRAVRRDGGAAVHGDRVVPEAEAELAEAAEWDSSPSTGQEHVGLVPGDSRIGGHESQALGNRLGDEHAIEGIVVMSR